MTPSEEATHEYWNEVIAIIHRMASDERVDVYCQLVFFQEMQNRAQATVETILTAAMFPDDQEPS